MTDSCRLPTNSPFSSGCTITMIGKSCAISAGHCIPMMKSYAEFDVPDSKAGKLTTSSAENVYEIIPESVVGLDYVIGNDWSVLNLRPNKVTKKLPGELHGYYSISKDPVKPGEEISIAGYGKDIRETLNGTLQIDRGSVLPSNDLSWGDPTAQILRHDVGTMPGGSGSVIIRERTQEIVGIHTNGGECNGDTANMGTVINSTKRMRKAIEDCLAR